MRPLVLLLCVLWLSLPAQAQQPLSPEQETLLVEAQDVLALVPTWRRYRLADQFETDLAVVVNPAWEIQQTRRERVLGVNRLAAAAKGEVVWQHIRDGSDIDTTQARDLWRFIYTNSQLIFGQQMLSVIERGDLPAELGIAPLLDFPAPPPVLLTPDLLATSTAVFDLGLRDDDDPPLQGYDFVFDPSAALPLLDFSPEDFAAELRDDPAELAELIRAAITIRGRLWVDTQTGQPSEMTLTLDFYIEQALADSPEHLSVVYGQTWQARYFNLNAALDINTPDDEESE